MHARGFVVGMSVQFVLLGVLILLKVVTSLFGFMTCFADGKKLFFISLTYTLCWVLVLFLTIAIVTVG